MDVFVEQIVAKKKDVRDIIKVTGTVLLSVLFVLLASWYLVMALPLVIVGAAWALWFFVGGVSREFEYSVTNQDIDIDEIMAKRRRRRVVGVTANKIKKIAPCRTADFLTKSYDRRVMASSSPASPDNWCFTYNSKKNGHTLVIFEPNERVLEAIRSGLPLLMRSEMDRQLHQL